MVTGNGWIFLLHGNAGSSVMLFYFFKEKKWLSALTTIALVNEDITGALDETFTAGDLGDYTITEADDGGTEVVLGAPLQFNPDNIEEMAKLY